MSRQTTAASALILSVTLSGCAAYEALGGMPYAESEMTFLSKPSTDRVLGCIQSVITSLGAETETTIVPGLSYKARHGWWATNFSEVKPTDGVLETGNYSDSNVAGVRIRAVYRQSSAVLRLQLKAAGAYYADLGAQKHMNQLRSLVGACVAA